MAVATTVRLGDAEIARIGLGTNRLTNTAEHVELVRGAVRAGIGTIDTALIYAGGGSERTIGEALSPFAPGVVVATKGAFRAGQGKPEVLRSYIEESLGRLRTDSIPLYHLHRVDPETPLEESKGVIKEYRDRGAIDPAGPVFEGTPSVLGSPNSPTYTGATALRASMPQVCSHTTRHASGVSAVEPSWHHGTGRLPPPTRSCHADEIASRLWPPDGSALRDYGDAGAMDPQTRWFRYLIDYIGELGASWAYWPLNGMNSPGGGRDPSLVEGYGLLTRDGRGPSNESRLAQLRTIQRAPSRTPSLRSDSRVQEQDANGGVDEHD